MQSKELLMKQFFLIYLINFITKRYIIDAFSIYAISVEIYDSFKNMRKNRMEFTIFRRRWI